MTIDDFGNVIKVTAPTAFAAFSSITDAVAAKGGDWAVSGPYEVGMVNGQIVTGYGYEARRTVPEYSRSWLA